jgi:hypothetical protein
MRWFALSLLLIVVCLWAYVVYDDGAAVLMLVWLAAGSLFCCLKPRLLMRLLDEASR